MYRVLTMWCMMVIYLLFTYVIGRLVGRYKYTLIIDLTNSQYVHLHVGKKLCGQLDTCST